MKLVWLQMSLKLMVAPKSQYNDDVAVLQDIEEVALVNLCIWVLDY
jgi:hypothetical protein